MLQRITLHLARSSEFPEGSAERGYEMVAPVDASGHLDSKEWRKALSRCVDEENQLRRIPVPPEIIHQAIWLYLRFTLSFRDVEDLLAERGLAVSYETVRRWVNHFGPMIAADLRKRR